MKVMTSRPEFDVSFGTEYYDWASLGDAQVVDVGGARGHFSIALAKRYDKIRVVVQDLANVVENADAGDLVDRVDFMAHDLFAPQTICADVFFFRWIFHNWPDKYCVRILKAQLPALKTGARLIVQEAFMPEKGTVPQWREANIRYVYLIRTFGKYCQLTTLRHKIVRWISRWRIPLMREKGLSKTGKLCSARPIQDFG